MEVSVPYRICPEVPPKSDIQSTKKADIGQILRKLCEEKKVEIIEAEVCEDHIHMLVSIPPHLSVAQFMGYLKRKSTLMIFDRTPTSSTNTGAGISGAEVLCGYSRKEQANDRRVHRKPVSGG